MKKKSFHKCEVLVTAGVLCGDEVSVLDGVTSNAIAHMRREAEKCSSHRIALDAVESKSGRRTDIDGSNVPVHTFRVTFPHHCRCVDMVVSGLSQNSA